MTANRLREARDSKPFRPFTLKMVDGTVYRVSHPDFLFVPMLKRARDVMFSAIRPDDDEQFTAVWLEAGLIEAIIIEPRPATSGPIERTDNGH